MICAKCQKRIDPKSDSIINLPEFDWAACHLDCGLENDKIKEKPLLNEADKRVASSS